MLHNSYRVNALDAWRELNGKQTKRTEGERRELELRSLARTLVFLFGTDLASQLCLYGAVHGWDSEAWSASSIGTSLVGAGAFRQETFDTVLLVLSRLLVMPLVATLAHKLGQIADESATARRAGVDAAAPRGLCGGLMCRPCGSSGGGGGASDSEPLLAVVTDAAQAEFEEAKLGVGERGAKHGTVAPSGSGVESALKLEQEADRRKASMLVLLFVVSTVAQVYTGVKCVSFKFNGSAHAQILQGLLMGSAVLWINWEAMLFRRLIVSLAGERGHFVPEFHPHRLFFDGNLACHYCDLCGSQLKQAYRCKLCDFDVCVRCFTRKDRSRGEGVLRGDKGVRVDEDLSGRVYFRRALKLCWPERHIFALAFACLAANSAASLALPNFQGAILDKVIAGNEAAFRRDIVTYVLISVGTGLFGGLRGLCFAVVGRRMAAAVRRKLFRGIICQDIAFFDGSTTGNLTSRLSNDANAMVSPCQAVLGTLFSNTILLLGGVSMCFYTSWRLSMLAFTTVGPVMVITETYAVWSQRLNRQIYAALGDANSVAVEALGNIRTVRAFSTEEMEMERYDVGVEEALKKGIIDAFGGAGTFALNNYLDLGAGVLILWYGGRLAMDTTSSLSVGQLITYQLYFNMINSAYQALINVVTQFTRAAGAAQRVLSLMDSLPDIPPDEGIQVDWTLRGDIELQGVSFHYQMRPDRAVLNDVHLQVPGGSVCAFVGRSGGGKSTLVHLLMRFYDPTAGQITLDGHPLKSLHLRSVHRQFGLVAQDTQLFANSVEENIAYGLPKGSYTRQELHAAARRAFAHDFIMEMPDGYATRVGERGVRLSGGQRQRIAIARVFLRKPRVLLLDEATSALDAESEALVQQALDELIGSGGGGGGDGKCTVVLVAHRLSTVMNADIIAVVDKGRIAERGTHDELVDAGGIYAKLVSRQMARQANQIEQDRVAAAAPGGPKAGGPKAAPDNIDSIIDDLERERGCSGAASTEVTGEESTFQKKSK